MDFYCGFALYFGFVASFMFGGQRLMQQNNIWILMLITVIAIFVITQNKR